jgi:hypothetical protein
MRKSLILLCAFGLGGCATTDAQPLSPPAVIDVEGALIEMGERDLAERLGMFRNCAGRHLIRTAGNQAERNIRVERAFASCATEEQAVRDFVVSRGPNPAADLSLISDYKALLKEDLLKRLRP